MDIIKLPFSTGGCHDSPSITFKVGLATAEFVHSDNGVIEKAKIEFTDALTVKFTLDEFVDSEMIEAYSAIVCDIELDSLLNPNTEFERKNFKRLIDIGYRRFRVYFDHYGGLEVFAKSVSFNSIKINESDAILS